MHKKYPLLKKVFFLLFLLFAYNSFSQIVQRGSATTNTITNSTLIIPKPAGLALGDLMLVNIAQATDSNNPLDNNPTSSGWKSISSVYLDGRDNRKGTVLYKIAVAADVTATDYSFSLDSDADSAVGAIIVFSGVDSSTPFDITSGTINSTKSTTVTASAITTVSANAAIVMLGQAGGGIPTWSGWTTASPGTLNELFDQSNSNGRESSIGGAWAIKATAGSTGEGSAKLSKQERNGAILLALRPSSSGISYCSSYGDRTDFWNTGVRLVNFNTINNPSPDENNDYSDFTAISTTVTKGQSYNLTVNVNTDGDYTNYSYAWIDWNQDGDFSDPGESLYLGTARNVRNGATSNSPLAITIPANASIGSTRMRVSTKYLSAPTSCETGFDGEVEDYTINVVPPISITTGTISPTSYCSGTSVSVPYSITGTYNAGNVFIAQLSNATGNFTGPVNIGTVTSTAAGTISGTIPFGTAASNGYRIRVVSSNPVITGTDNGINLTVNAAHTAPIVDTITQPTCTTATGSVILSGLPATGTWVLTQSPGGTTFTGTGTSTTISNLSPGTYTYTVTDSDIGTGLKADYFNNITLTGSPALTRRDATVNFDWGNGNPGAPIGNDNFSVRWSGQIQPLYSENYTFTTTSDDGTRLWVNGTQIINDWNDHGIKDNTGTILLSAGVKYDIVLEYYENQGGAVSKLSWSSSSQTNEIIPQSQLYPIAGGCSSSPSENVVINPQPLPLTNNELSFSNGISGTLCGTANENGVVNLSAPAETVFNYVNFASYGTPGGTCGNFTVNSNCHALTSKAVTELYLLGNNTAAIPATNTIFGDPCSGTVKRLNVLASYSQPICNGTDPGTISGTLPSGGDGNYTYLWESSITGPDSGFTQASGVNTTPNFNPGILTATTWFKRTVTSSDCTNQSPVLLIQVKQDNIWTGNTDTDWNTASNWACNSIPSLSTNVVINTGLTNYPILNPGIPGMAKDIQINSGASLTVLNNTLQIAGSITNTGEFNSFDGTIEMKGNVSQTIPANTFVSNRIRNLIINKTSISGVTLGGILEITGYLNATIGDLNTGGFLTLFSDATQTALIDGSGNGQVIGLVKMQRYLDVAFGYKYFSSPFSNSIVGDFSSYVDLTAAFPNFYTYDENRQDASNNDATGWKAYTSSAATLDVLTGYALNFGNSLTTPNTIEISGKVNNGDQQIVLVNNKRKYTDGFNLVGNPYPSPIDWNSTAGWTKSNIDNALYFFTAGNTNMYTGTYTSYVNGVQSADGLSSNIIPSMQGFFVHVTDTGIYPVSGTLGMTNEVRVSDFSQEFLKTPESGKFMHISKQILKSPEPEKFPLIRITAAFENQVNTDPAVIYFPNFAELSFEKDKDALKLMNTDVSVPNLYSLTPENKKLSINALPNPGSNDVKKIPLGLKTEKEGWMSIGLKDLQNFSSNFNIYLIDSEKRIGQNLSRKPQYRFYAKSGQHDSRFHLMFSETELSDPAIAFDEPFSVKTLGGKVMVNMNLEKGQSGVLIASTVTGQILDRKNVSEKQTLEIEGIKSSGVYFFSINLKDGMFSKKVLIQK